MKAAVKTDWELYPLPAKRTTLAIRRQFDRSQMERIRHGVIPESMDDRWFIYYEDDTLYLHRSWTGYCCFVVTLKEIGNGAGAYAITQCLASRHEEEYSNTNDAEDIQLLNSLIDELLLGIAVH